MTIPNTTAVSMALLGFACGVVVGLALLHTVVVKPLVRETTATLISHSDELIAEMHEIKAELKALKAKH